MPRVLTVVWILLLVALQYRLWIADGGLAHAHRLKNEVVVQLDGNAALRARNAALDAEISDLKSGVAAIEARARTLLGMIRPNETFYLIVRPS